MRVHLDYGSDGLDVDVPDDRTDGRRAAPRAGAGRPGAALCARRWPRPIGRPPLADARPRRLTAWPSRCATSPARSRAALMLEALFAAMPEVRRPRRDDPRRHRHAPRQHRRRTRRACSARRDRRALPRGQPRRPRRRVAGLRRPAPASRVPIWLNRHWLDADVRITTGFVEPHFFAGFSGGPKMVAPGLAGPGHDAGAARRPACRPSQRHLGHHRGQPGARRRARDRPAAPA